MLYLSAKRISIFLVKDIVFDLLYWPIWWYTAGALKILKICFKELKDQANVLGLGVWISNLFTPMFGQYDIEGRVISFFVRLIQIIFRLVVLFIWLIILSLIFLLWVILPIIVLYQLSLYFYE